MKKVLALALALVMALSMGTMAFAADTEADASAAAPVATTSGDPTVMGILDMLVSIIKASFSQWDAIESVVIRLVDFIENIGTAAVSEADVKGAVADLEAALAGAEIPGVEDLLNQLKQKIKDLYAGEVATTVVEETTVAEPAADTGSSSVGIALFAAVSVAAAAAYVCTKKSK